MNYPQTLDYLFNSVTSFQQVGASAYKPGLERVEAFCRYMGNPERDFLSIHIAGTNGKGSTSHMIASVLQSAGYCVGLYTSPHLRDFRERMRVDGGMISEREVVEFVNLHRPKIEELGLSFFEITTVMAFDFFSKSGVEVAVIETGLGGRLDATNVMKNKIVDVLQNIKKFGAFAGLSFNPTTSVLEILPYIYFCDMLLVMSVIPGKSGQEFMPETLVRLDTINKFLKKQKMDVVLEVDGGVNDKNVSLLKEKNVDSVVLGNYLYTSGDLKNAISKIKTDEKKPELVKENKAVKSKKEKPKKAKTKKATTKTKQPKKD